MIGVKQSTLARGRAACILMHILGISSQELRRWNYLKMAVQSSLDLPVSLSICALSLTQIHDPAGFAGTKTIWKVVWTASSKGKTVVLFVICDVNVLRLKSQTCMNQSRNYRRCLCKNKICEVRTGTPEFSSGMQYPECNVLSDTVSTACPAGPFSPRRTAASVKSILAPRSCSH